MAKELQIKNEFFSDVKKMIDSARQKLATEVNSTMSALYWKIGNRINQDLLKTSGLNMESRQFQHLPGSFNLNMEQTAFPKKICAVCCSLQKSFQIERLSYHCCDNLVIHFRYEELRK